MPPLMPCPWCGTAASIDGVDMPPVWAACLNKSCLVTGPAALTVDAAAEKWNGLAALLHSPEAVVRAKALLTERNEGGHNPGIQALALAVQISGGVRW